jgi:hypothetical protein
VVCLVVSRFTGAPLNTATLDLRSLARGGLLKIGTAKDGNCFFHCTDWLRNGPASAHARPQHMQMRGETCDMLETTEIWNHHFSHDATGMLSPLILGRQCACTCTCLVSSSSNATKQIMYRLTHSVLLYCPPSFPGHSGSPLVPLGLAVVPYTNTNGRTNSFVLH